MRKKQENASKNGLPDELSMRGKYFDDDGFDDIDFEVKYGGRMKTNRKHDSYVTGAINCVGKCGGVNGGQAGIFRLPLSAVPESKPTKPFSGSSYNHYESSRLTDNFGTQHIQKEKKNEEK